jgi:hypothetical protein
MKNYKLERLQNGETFTTNEKGNSMVPLIKSGQDHILAPSKWEDCNEGDIVYCKVKGRFYTHLVKGKNEDKGLLIGNNKGGINYIDGYGDNEEQSPIWIRPKSLKRSNAKSDLKKMYIQIVGHTEQSSIDITGKSTGGRYYFIDTLPSGEYLVEENNEFKVGKL